MVTSENYPNIKYLKKMATKFDQNFFLQILRITKSQEKNREKFTTKWVELNINFDSTWKMDALLRTEK